MLASNVSVWLKHRNINVPTDWLSACVNWLKSEHTGPPASSEQIRKLVYEQWLSTDLTDLEQPVLPGEVLLEKYTLNGKYCLQLLSVLDISQPAYNQLLQLQKKDNSNSNVCAETQVTQKPWESKPTRMLMLKLSDGIFTVEAIEYQKIPSLNDAMPPGCKVLVKGPVLCRNGVLMLASHNIEVLGGEVEDIFHDNCRETNLHKALKLPVPAPNQLRNPAQEQNDEITTANSEIVDLPDDVLSQLMDDDDDDVEIRAVSRTMSQQISTMEENIPIEIFEEDDYDVEVLQEVERMEAQMRQSSNNDHRLSHPAVKHVVPSTQGTNNHMGAHHTPYTGPSSDNQSKPSTKPSSSKQLSIKDAFNQTFRPISAHLVSCVKSDVFSPIPTSTSMHTSSRKRKISGLDFSAKSENLQNDHKDPTIKSFTTHAVNSSTGGSVGTSNRVSTTIQPQEQFMYIKSAKSKAQLMQVEFLTKAFIVTLHSKLEIDDSKMWRLTARICDGTGMLDVDFSDPVLTGLIGFSAAQAEEIRQNPDDRLRSLRMATASCRREIIQMCRIMKIRMGNPLKRARVVLLREADESYWRRFNMTTC